MCTFLLDNHVSHLMAGNAPVGWAECYGGRILSQEGVCQSKGKTFGEISDCLDGDGIQHLSFKMEFRVRIMTKQTRASMK